LTFIDQIAFQDDGATGMPAFNRTLGFDLDFSMIQRIELDESRILPDIFPVVDNQNDTSNISLEEGKDLVGELD
jgi:hypothetical protein